MQCADGTDCDCLGCRYGGCQGRRPLPGSPRPVAQQLIKRIALSEAHDGLDALRDGVAFPAPHPVGDRGAVLAGQGRKLGLCEAEVA